MDRSESTPSTKGIDFKEAIKHRIEYRLEKDETPVGGLNPHHTHYTESGVANFRLIFDNLHPTKADKVLEIGYGTGRISVPCVKYFGDNYHGFDNNRCFAEYCQALSPNLIHLDVFHNDWNPTGTIDPTAVEFPYHDRQFSIVFAFLVFNHFRFSWFERYISEISRILIKGGKLFTTIIIAKESKKIKPPFQFSFRTETEWYDYDDAPLYNIAFPEVLVRRVFIKNDMTIIEPIKYGRWNKSPLALTGHDVLMSYKRK